MRSPFDMRGIVLCPIFSVSLSSLVFPATLNFDQLEVSGLVEYPTGHTRLRIVFSLLSFSRISVGEAFEDIPSLPNRFSLSSPNQTSVFNFTDYSCVDRGYPWPSPLLVLGIGPTSEFMQQAGSFSVIRHASNKSIVSVKISENIVDFVSQSCRHNSAFLIPFEDDDYRCIDVTVRIRVGAHLAYPEEVFQSCYGSRVLAQQLSEYEFMTVPEWISQHLIRSIRDWGANPQDTYFTECDRSVLLHLPDLELSFISSWQTVGTVILSAEDYLIVNEEAETCRFRFRAVLPTINRLHVDLLRLPFINVQLTRFAIILCDPV
jgi:hypothetical protein